MENFKTQGIRTFEMTVVISGKLDLPYDEWPDVVKDRIEEALELRSQIEKIPLTVVYGEYKEDYDLDEDAPGRHYLHVIASEIVMADERTIDPRRIMSEVPDEIKRLLN